MKLSAKELYFRRIDRIIANVDNGIYGDKEAMKDIRHARNCYAENLNRVGRKED